MWLRETNNIKIKWLTWWIRVNVDPNQAFDCVLYICHTCDHLYYPTNLWLFDEVYDKLWYWKTGCLHSHKQKSKSEKEL